jgi:hypothetical protein
MSLKNPVTRPGIVPGTVRLVAQRLNLYATPGLNNNNMNVCDVVVLIIIIIKCMYVVDVFLILSNLLLQLCSCFLFL